MCSRLYQRDVERSHVTRIILELCPLSVVAEENRLKVTIAFTTYLPRPSHGARVGAEDTWRTLVLRRRLTPRPSTMPFCRLAARLVKILLRQVWPPAGSARRVVPHDPLPHERVLLSPDLSGVIFSQLCNTLDPGVVMAFSSASSELWALTHAQRQQLKADFNAAAALSLKLGIKSCKELREAKTVEMHSLTGCGLSEDDLATFGTLGSLLPALDKLVIAIYPNYPLVLGQRAGPDGVQRLAEKLGAGALPALTSVSFHNMHMGDAGASALAAALDRGALPRLKHLGLHDAAIGDAGMVALAPALRRLPELRTLCLSRNRLLGDEGAAALVAPPPPPAGAPPPPTGVLMTSELRRVWLIDTRITDTGCAALAAALRSGALPALQGLFLGGTPASDASKAAVTEVLVSRRAGRDRC